MINVSATELAAARRSALWNSVVSKHAVEVEYEPGRSLRFLHATKGWRSVSVRRLRMLGL